MRLSVSRRHVSIGNWSSAGRPARNSIGPLGSGGHLRNGIPRSRSPSCVSRRALRSAVGSGSISGPVRTWSGSVLATYVPEPARLSI
jgi:hypothetical protein